VNKTIRKIIFNITFSAAIFVSLSGGVSCKKSETEARKAEARAKEEKAKAEKRLQIKKSIDEMVDKHNAVADWEIGLFPYTIQVENVLARKDGKPVRIIARVHDIVRQEEKYLVYFYKGMPFSHFVYPECYAVIADISAVKKVRFELRADGPEVEDYEGPEDVQVDLGPFASNFFIANGLCLELLPLGNYADFAPSSGYEDDVLMQETWSVDKLLTSFCFVLECTSEQVERIMSQRAESAETKGREKL
jgi:hypothetical protein